jgi:Na+-translocating ferredoxin:NAD+ oxidoreductase RnfA subunit
MNAELFVVNLLLVVLFLGLTLFSGRRGNRELHYGMALNTVLFLFLAIIQAEIFGRSFEFNPIRLNIHLWFAFTALISLPGVVWSGLRLRKNGAVRKIHQRWVAGFVLLTLSSIVTAGWMFLDATPIAPVS